MRSSGFEVFPTSGAVGAEILGINLAEPLTKSDVEELRGALLRYGVIFFRDQKFTPEQHIRFAEYFGHININRFFKPVNGYPQVAEVRKEPDQKKNIGEVWHTDHSYDQIPALGSILVAREVPPYGGDTMFASMHHAYDALSDGLKATLEGMRAVHSSRQAFGSKEAKELGEQLGNTHLAAQDQDAIHPVIIRHPQSGKKMLYVNASFTTHFEGWTAEESAPLLKYLFDHGSRPEFTTRFRFREGSVAFWDNRSTWHFAINDYQGQRRVMHRITIDGEKLA